MTVTATHSGKQQRQIMYLALAQIVADPRQPRTQFDADDLKRLADSIREGGIKNPLRVRPLADGRYSLVGGERRCRAAALAGETHVPAIIETEPLSEGEERIEQLADNLLHTPLSGLEIAEAAQASMSLLDITASELAARLHVSHSRLSMALSLLDLPASIREMVRAGRLKENLAYHLSRLHDQPEAQLELAERALQGGLTRDAAAEEVNRLLGRERVPKPKAGRLTLRLAGGVAITLSSSSPWTLESVNQALEEVRKAAARLQRDGKDVDELIKSFKPA